MTEESKQEIKENFLKRRSDTITIICTLITVMYMMFSWERDKFDKIDAKFDKIDDKFDKIDAKFASIEVRFAAIDSRMNAIENRLTTIETVLMCNKIMPNQMSKGE